MSIALVTGAGGLVGSASVRYLADKFDGIIGIENNSRATFFGWNASVIDNLSLLEKDVKNFRNWQIDIRDADWLEQIFAKGKFDLIIHTAAQPSHDWSKTDVLADFNINAVGTLNLLELTRSYCPEAAFVFTSTNKVYGDAPNRLPFIDLDTRVDLAEDHPFYNGVDESMSIDRVLHTFFGVSKASADLLVQEYARSLGLKTGVFRCGCITGKNHQGVPLHGFLSYLVKCTMSGTPYTVYGYQGKQVRDNIHASDLVAAFYEFYKSPRPGAVYNLGGGRANSCSVLEAIAMAEKATKQKLDYQVVEQARMGDHHWWISNNQKFMHDFPSWNIKYDLEAIISEMV